MVNFSLQILLVYLCSICTMPIREVTQEAFNFKDGGGEPAQVFLSPPVFKSLHWAGCPFSSSPSPVQDLGGLKVFKITSSTEYDGKCQRDILPPFQPLVAVGCDWSAYWSAHSNQTQGALVVVVPSTRLWWFLEQVQKGPRFRLIGQPKRWRTIQKDTNDNLLVKSTKQPLYTRVLLYVEIVLAHN